MAAHARGSSRGAEQNTNIFLTAYAGHGIVTRVENGSGGDEAARAAPAFQTYPASSALAPNGRRACVSRSPHVRSRRLTAGAFQPNWGAPAPPINKPNPLMTPVAWFDGIAIVIVVGCALFAFAQGARAAAQSAA